MNYAALFTIVIFFLCIAKMFLALSHVRDATLLEDVDKSLWPDVNDRDL